LANPPPDHAPPARAGRLPLYYGWVVVAVAFVTMAVGVNIRTSFSLLFPPILDEFGWNRGVTAAAFSFGFLVSAAAGPLLGAMMDRYGPRVVIPAGTNLVALGLLLATLTTKPWHLYMTLGVMVVGGTVSFSYMGHSMFLPNWFVRKRGLAIGLAFSGVGVGSIVFLPWLQTIIVELGWRLACMAMLFVMLLVMLPLNLILQRHRPEELGLLPDGATAPPPVDHAKHDAAPDARPTPVVNWTIRRAVVSAPFWWLNLGYFSALFAWYLVQVHQTKYLIEIGIGPETAAVALGLVALFGIIGQILMGYLSDRIGREWAWTLSCMGFAVCYALLLYMAARPSPLLMYLMVASQGVLGYGLASNVGAIPADIFTGPGFARIFGFVSISSILGGAAGPWVGGLVQDITGSYDYAFWLGVLLSLVSIVCIWFAAPRKGGVR